MKLGLVAVVLALSAGTSFAQPAVLVPHRGHVHVVPVQPVTPYWGVGNRPSGWGVSGIPVGPRVWSGSYRQGSSYGPWWNGRHHKHHHHGHHQHHHGHHH